MSEQQTDRPGEESATSRCAQVRQALLEVLHPGESLPAPLQDHLQRCPGCQRLRSQLVLLDEVAREQAVELPEGFEISLQRRLQQTAARQARQPAAGSRRRGRLVFAAAAAVLLSVAAIWLATHWHGTGGDVPPTYHRLRLAIQATEEHPEVLFDVDLPDGVSPLAGTGELIGRGRSLQWRSALHRGLNELDLPLMARRPRGQVRVRLSAGGQHWTAGVAFDAAHASLDPAAPGHEHEVRLALVLTAGEADGQRGTP